MLRSDCAHLKPVDRNNILETSPGTLKCDVNRAEPDPTSRAGISCPSSCMAYRPISANKKPPAKKNSSSPIESIKKVFLSLLGK